MWYAYCVPSIGSDVNSTGQRNIDLSPSQKFKTASKLSQTCKRDSQFEMFKMQFFKHFFIVSKGGTSWKICKLYIGFWGFFLWSPLKTMKKSCLKELKFCEILENPKSSIFSCLSQNFMMPITPFYWSYKSNQKNRLVCPPWPCTSWFGSKL